MKKEIDKIYNHIEVEKSKYKTWIENDCFKPRGNGEPFCIVLPPPNVTGVLHVGHAFDTAIQDVMVRYKRLQGFKTIFIPGTDHAGIATQTKFEAFLKSENKPNRETLGRTEFLKQLMEWKDIQSNIIHEQWAKMGLSLDYSQEKFTMDKDVNAAVNKVFIDLYNNKLIYRGKKLVNWDIKLQTAISDIEVIHKPVFSKLYYIKYYLDNKFKKYLEVATSRPETMFGDVCIFVNPTDKKYKKFIGQKVLNPANNQWIPILADKYIDINFGTGVMKCTPAHDFNDYELGMKHKLEVINIMNSNGTMNEICGKYEGMDRLICRKKFVEFLSEQNFITKIDDKYETKIGYSERTNEIVEPFMSNQWFIKMKPLAEKVLLNQKQKKANSSTTFMPKRFEKSLNHWLNNIEDWCISRQLWWGHQLPIWYNNSSDEIYVGDKAPKDAKNWTRDEDVLDTWFSSGLWPMVVLGWPKQTKNSSDFFPNSILVTGYDILTFWVSRMMMLSTYFTDKTPFHKIYIHGLIRDEKGRKMSKSLGNGVDPMEVIEKYGADTLRLFLTSSSTIGEDLNFSFDKLKSNWGLINKLWNSARYILGYVTNQEPKLKINKQSNEICLWILNRFNKMLVNVTKYMDEFNFVVATRHFTDFIWNDFCSVFIELSKSIVNNPDYKDEVISTMLFLLKNILIMLHPQCPFMTEEIYQLIPSAKKTIMKENWPEKILNLPKESKVQFLVQIIYIIRKVRLENKIPNSTRLELNILVKDNIKKVSKSVEFLNTYLINLNAEIKNVSTISLIGNKITEIANNFIIEIPFEKNNEEEVEKIKQLIVKLEQEVNRSNKILSNQSFITKASNSKISDEKNKLKKYEEQLASAKESLSQLIKG
ncbi:MAG: valine--tRNA ligase [Mycoplasma sp.]